MTKKGFDREVELYCFCTDPFNNEELINFLTIISTMLTFIHSFEKSNIQASIIHSLQQTFIDGVITILCD